MGALAMVGSGRPRGVALTHGWVFSNGSSGAPHASGQPDSTARTLVTGACVWVPAGVAATVSGGLSGVGDLAVFGAGTLVLSAANTYTGATRLQGGTVQYSTNQSITGPLSSDGTNLIVNGTNNPLAGIGRASSVTVSHGQLTSTNGVDNGLFGNTPAPTQTVTLGPGGVLTQPGNRTYHLPKLVLAGGTLHSGPASGIAIADGTWNLDRGLTVAAGSGVTSTISAPTLALTQAGGTVFDVGISGASPDLRVTGSIDKTGHADNGLIKTGDGVMTLESPNTYASGKTLHAGTLVAGHANAFGTGPITVNPGGTLALKGFAIANTIIPNGGTVTP